MNKLKIVNNINTTDNNVYLGKILIMIMLDIFQLNDLISLHHKILLQE